MRPNTDGRGGKVTGQRAFMLSPARTVDPTEIWGGSALLTQVRAPGSEGRIAVSEPRQAGR
jgi:hypothetical protein